MKRIALLLAFFAGCLLLSAQIPQGFNYQAVARNSSGGPIANYSLPVRITIQSDSLGGTIFWQELHSSVATTDQGVINLVIGRGSRQTPSTVATFSTIDWSLTPKFMKTEIDYNGWKTMGVTRLWSVPYALRAKDSDQWLTNGANIYKPAGNVGIGTSSPSSKLTIQPPDSWADDVSLFEVRNKTGVPVLAVYNNGVRILIDHTINKSLKGGFAVGGYDQTKAGKTVDFMTISPDSIRFNINNETTKGLKGGFAVGGFDVTKGPINQDFMYITPQSSYNGQYNTFLGYKAGLATTEAFNVFVGYNAGIKNTTGRRNTFVGFLSGASNTIGGGNCFYGDSSGYSNSSGYYNTYIGTQAGFNNYSSENVLIGFTAGYSSTAGLRNVFIGSRAGYSLTSSRESVIIGHQAAFNGTGEIIM